MPPQNVSTVIIGYITKFAHVDDSASGIFVALLQVWRTEDGTFEANKVSNCASHTGKYF